MKELLKDEFDSNKVEIVEEKQHKKEIKLIGQQRKVNGLILWEFNFSTGVLCRAKYSKVNVFITGLGDGSASTTNTHKVVVNENCHYLQALNSKNAIKHIRKNGYKSNITVTK